MTLVADVMRTKVATCSLDTSVYDACTILKEHNTSTVIVVDDNQEVLGVFSERDLVNRVVSEKLNPEETKVQEVMTSPAICAEADQSDVQVIHLIISKHVKKIPVVNNKKLVGVVAESDLLIHLAASTLDVKI